MINKILFFLFLSLGLFFGVNYSIAADACPADFIPFGEGLCVPSSTSTHLNTPLDRNPIVAVVESVMMWLLMVVGAIAIIAFVISGLQYFLAAGDQNSMESAKRNVVWSIVGVVVALSGIVILGFIEMMLS